MPVISDTMICGAARMILSRLFTMPLTNAIISVGTAATSSGMHLIIPSISANRRSMPIWIMFGSSTMIAASKLPIIIGTAAISCGIASIRPCASVIISKIAVSMSCVKKSGLVSICTIVKVTCTMPSISVGRFSIRPFARKKRMSIAACVIAGRLSMIPCPNAPTSATAACKSAGRLSVMVVMTIGIIVVDADVTSCEMPPNMTLTRGIIFPAAVSTLLTKLPISVSRSALSAAMPVIRLLHADFAALTLP